MYNKIISMPICGHFIYSKRILFIPILISTDKRYIVYVNIFFGLVNSLLPPFLRKKKNQTKKSFTKL
jgi:hypothetical protein